MNFFPEDTGGHRRRSGVTLNVTHHYLEIVDTVSFFKERLIFRAEAEAGLYVVIVWVLELENVFFVSVCVNLTF